jgi:asparagine synthase (glutamine-hydrolysing)
MTHKLHDRVGVDIAGVIEAQAETAMLATANMARYLTHSMHGTAHSSLISDNWPAVAIAVTGPEMRTSRGCANHPAYFKRDGLGIVLSGRITNANEICEDILGFNTVPAQERINHAILAAYSRFGPRVIARLQGAFAIAIWDGPRNQLFLARDRLGIKPLYYYKCAGTRFVFGSKVKALLASGLVPQRLSHPGIHSYLVYGVTCEPYTAIEDVYALPAAHSAVIRNGEISLYQYWDVFANSEYNAIPASVEEAAAELRPLLNEAVRLNTRDVSNTGVFLSGGMDSSALAALMKQETGIANTVSLAVDGMVQSDKPFIDLMVKHLNAEHASFTLSPPEAHGWLKDYFSAMDQPTVDGLNAYAASRVAKANGYTGALYGVGGDELFGPVWNLDSVLKMERAARLPGVITMPAGIVLGTWRKQAPARIAREWLGRAAKPGTAFDFLSRYLSDNELRKLWRGAPDADAMLGRLQLEQPVLYPQLYSRLTVNYFLKNQLLRIADWVGGYHGIEIRSPFLDQSVVDLAFSLPPDFKVGAFKPVLACAIADIVPKAILTREKVGFGIPLQHWMKDQFRLSVESSLRRPPEAVAELIDTKEIAHIWTTFMRTGDRWRLPWGLYTLCQWVENLDSGDVREHGTETSQRNFPGKEHVHRTVHRSNDGIDPVSTDCPEVTTLKR